MLDPTRDGDVETSDDAFASSPQHSARIDIPVRLKAGTDVDDDVEHSGADNSLLEDVSAVYEDGKAYLSSELAFQKTRAKYVGSVVPKIAAFGAAAALLGLVALIALSVGMILALETLVGPLAATLIVVAVLLLGAGVLAYLAKSKVAQMSRAMSGGRP